MILLLAACGGTDPGKKKQHANAERVVVIGAGMAGIAAATTLQDEGYDVVVLEARDRVGGRVWTDRSGDVPLDLGASWIHGRSGNPISGLADELGLKRVVTDYEDARIRRADGSVQSWIEPWALWTSFNAHRRDIRTDLGDAGSMQDAFDDFVDAEALTDDEMDLLQFAVSLIVEDEYADNIDDLSLKWFWQEAAFGGPDEIFPDGYDAIPTTLAAELDVRLEHPVHTISYDDDGVVVQADPDDFDADYVVCTVPLGVLQAGMVSFEPGLPQRKLDAMDGLGMGVLDKTYVQFADADVFWDDTTMVEYFDPSRPGEYAESVNLDAVLGEPVLVGFNSGSRARDLEPLSDEATADRYLDGLENMYGERPRPVRTVVTRWDSDPWALGSYSHVRPGGRLSDHAVMAEPVGRVYFAGEHTNADYPATVHGAWLSGLAAAEAIAD